LDLPRGYITTTSGRLRELREFICEIFAGKERPEPCKLKNLPVDIRYQETAVEGTAGWRRLSVCSSDL
jgi:hypothetical protein